MDKKEFICKYCGKNFSPNYNISSKKTLHFCSKSCKSKFQKQKYFNKTQLENAIKKIIQKNEKYTTRKEIIQELHISEKTLTKFNISILGLNRELHMKKPQSIFETVVGEYLNDFFPDLQSQITFEDCLSPKGYLLKFDFYSKSHNIVIEADGKQHFDKNHIFSSDYTIQCDQIKEQYCIKNNIKLIRIPYCRNVTKEYVMTYINN